MTVSSRPMILSVLVAVATIPVRARGGEPPPSPTTTAAVSAAAAPPPGPAAPPVPAVARAEEALPSPPALPASATPAATAPAATATAPAQPASTIPIAGLDKLSVSGGAILWYYQPLTSGGQNNFDLYYANVVSSLAMARSPGPWSPTRAGSHPRADRASWRIGERELRTHCVSSNTDARSLLLDAQPGPRTTGTASAAGAGSITWRSRSSHSVEGEPSAWSSRYPASSDRLHHLPIRDRSGPSAPTRPRSGPRG